MKYRWEEDIRPRLINFVQECETIRTYHRPFENVDKEMWYRYGGELYSEDEYEGDFDENSYFQFLRELSRMPMNYVPDDAEIRNIMEALSQLFLTRSFIRLISKIFQPFLMDIIARITNKNSLGTQLKNMGYGYGMSIDKNILEKIERICYSLALILPIAPYLEKQIIYFFDHGCTLPPFSRVFCYDSPESSRAYLKNMKKNNDGYRNYLDMVQTTYRMLRYSRLYEYFVEKWDWHPFYDVLYTTDIVLKWYGLSTMILVLGISDREKSNILCHEHVSDADLLSLNMPNPWILEKETLAKFKHDALNGVFFSSSVMWSVNEKHLSSNIVDIAGVLMWRPPEIPNGERQRKNEIPMVPTETTARNLNKLAGIILHNNFLILLGPSGSGKTSLVKELASRMGFADSLVTLHLGDQMDGKTLLGTYVCNENPGEFAWQPGVLVNAMQRGQWILLEDIDLASMDVVTIIAALAKNGNLSIPSHDEKMKMHTNFRLFATISRDTGDGERATRSAEFLLNFIDYVKIEALDNLEIHQVLDHRFPRLGIIKQLIAKLRADLLEDGVSLPGRRWGLTLTDLLRWCARVNLLADGVDLCRSVCTLPAVILEEMFLETIDCFLSAIHEVDLRNKLLSKVAFYFNISEDRVIYHLHYYSPELEIQDSYLRVGRARLPINIQGADLPSDMLKFVHTRQSLRLLERLAVCVFMNEPVLLVGETGIGKTLSTQHLARLLNKKLVVINMSQQSESADLFGNFRPVDLRSIMTPLKDSFDILFDMTFSQKANTEFLGKLRKWFAMGNWSRVLALFHGTLDKVKKKLGEDDDATPRFVDEYMRKKRRAVDSNLLRQRWSEFGASLKSTEIQMTKVRESVLFRFIEGALVQCIRKGDWLLLDELNLAPTETLQSLNGLLDKSLDSITLLDKCAEMVSIHPEFRLFACMNPIGDVSKRELPAGIRARFTEFYIEEPDDKDDLETIVTSYLGEQSDFTEKIVDFYQKACKLCKGGLSDGANQRIHYSLRSLTRSLSYALQASRYCGLQRALYEGICVTFSTQLRRESKDSLMILLMEIFGNVPIDRNPTNFSDEYELVEGIPLRKGPHDYSPEDRFLERFILTPSIKQNLLNLARAVRFGTHPVLIQGPTSGGKTSIIEYLARRVNQNFVRINNHEHTDIQEYIGSYVPDANGNIIFRDGILVDALRKGLWIVLDELNLAPSDVLEALNRLLDDNRELFVPETQERIRPHRNFLLFATQNPAGLYGGRKMLSRAFRNRFLELNFDEIPEDELVCILEQRCTIAPSFCRKIVSVFKELRLQRQASNVFAGRDGYITLRDLFKWAERHADTYQKLAEDGFMILAERARRREDRNLVKNILEKFMLVKIDESAMYQQQALAIFQEFDNRIRVASPDLDFWNGIVWSPAMKRLLVLVYNCVKYDEPILLIGETGGGKTTIFQLISFLHQKNLRIINCHQNSEASDFLGSQRPTRNNTGHRQTTMSALVNLFNMADCSSNIPIGMHETKWDLETMSQLYKKHLDNIQKAELQNPELRPLIDEMEKLLKEDDCMFQWQDGPLLQAMEHGDYLLIDEISLAEDAVLERLNSVLEPSRSLFVAEKNDLSTAFVKAKAPFCIFATMNPGGDYGKRELSLALRNRFTEIWVPSTLSDTEETLLILQSRLTPTSKHLAFPMIQFIDFILVKTRRRWTFTLRDCLLWADFIKNFENICGTTDALIHGIFLLFLDGIDIVLSGIREEERIQLINDCMEWLLQRFELDRMDLLRMAGKNVKYDLREGRLYADSLSIICQASNLHEFEASFPTSGLRENVFRIIRAMQARRPLLIEGSPGVGKTFLITSLSKLCRIPLVRMNLSEHTDISDFFGADLPCEDNSSSLFEWRDGPFLDAMQKGYWVLLDELNLASQSVLEGLNACFDHRETVFVPELGRSFRQAPNFRVFACQNPFSQGGGRKALPKSFINRFVKITIQSPDMVDESQLLLSQFKTLDAILAEHIVQLNARIRDAVTATKSFGQDGMPWNFNLRDLIRFLEFLSSRSPVQDIGNSLGFAFDLIYISRMRTHYDREQMMQLIVDSFTPAPQFRRKFLYPQLSFDTIHIGQSVLGRQSFQNRPNGRRLSNLFLNPNDRFLEQVASCLEKNWMVILTGPTRCDRARIITSLAALSGNHLEEIYLTESFDSLELLGGYEQVDPNRRLSRIRQAFKAIINRLGNIISRCEQPIVELLHVIGCLECQISDIVEKEELLDMNREDVLSYCMHHLRILKPFMEPTIFSDLETQFIDILRQFAAYLQEARRESNRREQKKCNFEWVDSIVLKAIIRGDWLLVDNANFANPAVLDRLNSLIEPNGVLVLSERGLFNGTTQIVVPNPEFRLILLSDPKYGEISRPLRNRGVEIHCELDSFGNHALYRPSEKGQIPLLDFLDSPKMTFAYLRGREMLRSMSILQHQPSAYDVIGRLLMWFFSGFQKEMRTECASLSHFIWSNFDSHLQSLDIFWKLSEFSMKLLNLQDLDTQPQMLRLAFLSLKRLSLKYPKTSPEVYSRSTLDGLSFGFPETSGNLIIFHLKDLLQKQLDFSMNDTLIHGLPFSMNIWETILDVLCILSSMDPINTSLLVLVSHVLMEIHYILQPMLSHDIISSIRQGETIYSAHKTLYRVWKQGFRGLNVLDIYSERLSHWSYNTRFEAMPFLKASNTLHLALEIGRQLFYDHSEGSVLHDYSQPEIWSMPDNLLEYQNGSDLKVEESQNHLLSRDISLLHTLLALVTQEFSEKESEITIKTLLNGRFIHYSLRALIPCVIPSRAARVDAMLQLLYIIHRQSFSNIFGIGSMLRLGIREDIETIAIARQDHVKKALFDDIEWIKALKPQELMQRWNRIPILILTKFAQSLDPENASSFVNIEKLGKDPNEFFHLAHVVLERISLHPQSLWVGELLTYIQQVHPSFTDSEIGIPYCFSWIITGYILNSIIPSANSIDPVIWIQAFHNLAKTKVEDHLVELSILRQVNLEMSDAEEREETIIRPKDDLNAYKKYLFFREKNWENDTSTSYFHLNRSLAEIQQVIPILAKAFLSSANLDSPLGWDQVESLRGNLEACLASFYQAPCPEDLRPTLQLGACCVYFGLCMIQAESCRRKSNLAPLLERHLAAVPIDFDRLFAELESLDPHSTEVNDSLLLASLEKKVARFLLAFDEDNGLFEVLGELIPHLTRARTGEEDRNDQRDFVYRTHTWRRQIAQIPISDLEGVGTRQYMDLKEPEPAINPYQNKDTPISNPNWGLILHSLLAKSHSLQISSKTDFDCFVSLHHLYCYRIGKTIRDLLLGDPHAKDLPVNDGTIQLFLTMFNPLPSPNFRDHANFYCDADETVCLEMGRLMEKSRRTLQTLLEQFPDNEILLSSLDICSRILQFQSVSPPLKFAVGLEILMEKLHQWEECAAKFCSLGSLLGDLMQEYIILRNRETDQIGHIVQIHREYYAEQTFKDTPMIFYVVRSLELDIDSTATLFLYEYIAKSPYAELFWRLSILEAILLILPSGKPAQKARIVLDNLVNHFKCLSPAINGVFSREIADINTQLDDLARLRHWNPTNDCRTLIDTIRRQNRQLSKVLGKLREQFDQSVITFKYDLNQNRPLQDKINWDWPLLKLASEPSDLPPTTSESSANHSDDIKHLSRTPELGAGENEQADVYFCINSLYSDILNTTVSGSLDLKALKNSRRMRFVDILRQINGLKLPRYSRTVKSIIEYLGRPGILAFIRNKHWSPSIRRIMETLHSLEGHYHCLLATILRLPSQTEYLMDVVHSDSLRFYAFLMELFAFIDELRNKSSIYFSYVLEMSAVYEHLENQNVQLPLKHILQALNETIWELSERFWCKMNTEDSNDLQTQLQNLWKIRKMLMDYQNHGNCSNVEVLELLNSVAQQINSSFPSGQLPIALSMPFHYTQCDQDDCVEVFSSLVSKKFEGYKFESSVSPDCFSAMNTRLFESSDHLLSYGLVHHKIPARTITIFRNNLQKYLQLMRETSIRYLDSLRLLDSGLKLYELMLKEGFRLPDIDNEKSVQEKLEKGGPGIGEGTGLADVTDQIENREQLEGLKNELEAKDEEFREREKNDETWSMDDDFEGKLEECEDDSSHESDDPNEADETELDDRMDTEELDPQKADIGEKRPVEEDEKYLADSQIKHEAKFPSKNSDEIRGNDHASADEQGDTGSKCDEFTNHSEKMSDFDVTDSDLENMEADNLNDEDNLDGFSADGEMEPIENLSNTDSSPEVESDQEPPIESINHDSLEGAHEMNIPQTEEIPSDMDQDNVHTPQRYQSGNQNTKPNGYGQNFSQILEDDDFSPSPHQEQMPSQMEIPPDIDDLSSGQTPDQENTNRMSSASRKPHAQMHGKKGHNSRELLDDASLRNRDISPTKLPGDSTMDWIRKIKNLLNELLPEVEDTKLTDSLELLPEEDYQFAQDADEFDAQIASTAPKPSMHDSTKIHDKTICEPERYIQPIPQETALIDEHFGNDPSELPGGSVRKNVISLPSSMIESDQKLPFRAEANHTPGSEILDLNQLRQGLERQLDLLINERISDQPHRYELAKMLWDRYEALTYDLALSLCEQLRLILEPTLKTKLQGDYRTGKRLNMRKIIPYIASHYRKDKIWLRRTKPNRRKYQVILAVDDSKSMASHRSIQLAYESLALLVKSLTLLEVGNVGVISFGEEVRLLHDPNQSFTSQHGAQVISQFTFKQDRTDLKSLMETSLKIFDDSRSSTNADLWQIEFIISDGICEHHDSLKNLVREALEKRIFPVFLILDNSLDAKESILDMKNVSYPNGKLVVRRYMDTFPFEYHMIVRHLETLPEILCDALRQWFEIIQGLY